MSVLRLALVCLVVASALAADVEVDTEVEYTSELDVEAGKPKRVAVNASLPVKVLDKNEFMPRSRVILVPKGDPRARSGFAGFSSSSSAVSDGRRDRAGQPRIVIDRRPPIAPQPTFSARSPVVLKSAAPRASARRPAPRVPAKRGPAKAPRAPAASTSTADCGVYANAPTTAQLGNGNVQYQVVRIAASDFTGTADNTMTKPTACAFARMAAAALKAGHKLTINSGFRSLARQQYFWNCYQTKSCNNGNLAAHPGTSNHGKGQAIDINTGDASSPTYRWLAANAARFGFKRTVPTEVWHWEYLP